MPSDVLAEQDDMQRQPDDCRQSDCGQSRLAERQWCLLCVLTPKAREQHDRQQHDPQRGQPVHRELCRAELPFEARVYEHLFTVENPLEEQSEERDFFSFINPKSLEVLTSCKVEPGLGTAKPGDRFQFLRQGYFCVDADSTEKTLLFNRTVSLRDTWAKIEKTLQQKVSE